MDGRFTALEEMMKKMLEDKQKTTTSETTGGHRRGGNPNPFRGRENPKVEVLEGDDGMPPLEPLSREERSIGFERRVANFSGKRKDFNHKGAEFERGRGGSEERGSLEEFACCFSEIDRNYLKSTKIRLPRRSKLRRYDAVALVGSVLWFCKIPELNSPRCSRSAIGALIALWWQSTLELLFNDFGDRVAQLLHVESVVPFFPKNICSIQQQILIVNTHLLFPHDYTLCIVRLHQVYKILQSIESYKNEHKLDPLPIILCGDWNGSKRGHVYKFLRSQGFVSSYDVAHHYSDSDADAHKWVSHRNHRGNICGVDFIWLLNPNMHRKPLRTSWNEALFGIIKVSCSHFLMVLEQELNIATKHPSSNGAIANGFEGHQNSSSPPPTRLLLQPGNTTTLNPVYTQWLVVDQNLAAAICSTISAAILTYVLHLERCSDIWNTLELRLQASNRSRVIQLKNELHNITMKDLTMQQYLNNIKTLVDNIAAAGLKIDAEDILLYTLNGLPPSYKAFKTSIRTKVSPISLENLYSLLLSEEINLAAEQSREQS
ncbi:hypothetical protein M5K25_026419 [Dendrobium thyrsiflorum]|uniref:Uncharacterized protein n=1 Tax=Dendrobium thyrsiflorum TaxID=117978 RepID=A0ABD0TXB2_DENTH